MEIAEAVTADLQDSLREPLNNFQDPTYEDVCGCKANMERVLIRVANDPLCAQHYATLICLLNDEKHWRPCYHTWKDTRMRHFTT